MDIRTKLVFALVTVALGSMLALGLLSYPRAQELMRQSARRALDGVAESKAADLENVVQGWRDRVRLIASRTQLRYTLATYWQTHSANDRAQIERIIADAQRSTPTVRRIIVFDADGHPVARAGADASQPPASLDLRRLREPRPVTYDGLGVFGEDSLEVSFLAELELEGTIVGAMQVVLSAQELIDVTTDYIGLNETGEVMIGYRSAGDSATIINPLRHVAGGPLSRRLSLANTGEPLVRAVLDMGDPPGGVAVDYRGEAVWAATRFLENADFTWGLVVKFDEEEEERPVRELRRYGIRLALSLSAFAILIGTLLGLSFARPIHELAEVANRIRAGELDARSANTSEDEIGLLARTFNQMADKLTGRSDAATRSDGTPEDRSDTPDSGA